MKKLMFICTFVFVLTIVATPSLAETVIITAEDKGINWISAEPIELYSYTGYNTFILPNPNPPPDEFEYEIEFNNMEMAIHATGRFVHCWNVIYAIVPGGGPVEEDRYIFIVDIFSEGDEEGFLHGVDEDFDLSETTIFGNTQNWTATPLEVNDLTVYMPLGTDLSPFGETTGRFFISEFFLPYGEVHKPTTTANGSITGTSVSVGMRIDVNGVTDVIGTDTGTTYASVDLISPSTGAQVSSMLNINSLSSEAANLNFKLSFDGTGLLAFGNDYLGDIYGGSNHAEIFYHADIDFTMGYSWNFDYIGPEPLGLGGIYVTENGTSLAELGNYGIIGHHEGSGTFNLLAGNDYTFEMVFSPNAQGDLWVSDGTLTGDISFNFVPTPPEETTTTTSDITTTTSDTTTSTTTGSTSTSTTSVSTSTTAGTTSTTASTTTTTTTGCTCDTGCNGTTISLPFTKNGSGQYCWQTTDNLSTVNSWNTNKVEINNQDYTNTWSNSFPAKIDGKYYIYYKSSVSWGHFEAAGGGTTTTTAGTTTTAASGCTCDSGCNGSSISPNFTKDGAGQFCWTATSGNYINSWNLNKLEVNNTVYTNQYVFTSSFPAKINGKWYIYYDGSYPWSHFELKN